MINLILDTSIFIAKSYKKDPNFKSLEKLSNNKAIKLHIPYVVKREYQTSLRKLYSDDIEKALIAINKLTKRKLPKALSDTLVNTKSELKNGKIEILNNVENEFSNWLKGINSSEILLCLDQAMLSMEAYFNGSLPLTHPKVRDDIPDSFIVQAINKLLETVPLIDLVVSDKKIINTFKNNQKVKVYKNLDSFIKSVSVQTKLKQIDEFQNILLYKNALKQNEHINDEIKRFLYLNIGEEIAWTTFSDSSIRDDNHEALISSCDDPENTQLFFDEAIYYGDGVIGVPFKLNITVLAEYSIYKSDYYLLDSEFETLPNISDLNDHYFEAEEEFNLEISGMITFLINSQNINFEEIEESFDEDSIKINVKDIKLIQK